MLCGLAVFVDVFGGDVDATVFPFEGVGDSERFETALLTEWRESRVAGYDIGEVECAAFTVVESDLQRVVRNVLCMCDF